MTQAPAPTLVIIVTIGLLVAAIGVTAVGVPSVVDDEGDTPPRSLDGLHRRGVTGENVTVGIVDRTGFDTGHPTLDGRVDGAASFGDGGGGATGGHGTASAIDVAEVAPDARFLLATARDHEDYRAAISWLLDREADVVLVPASFLGRRWADDGVGLPAVRNGTVFVAPTGNLGNAYWRGPFSPANESGGRTEHRFRSGPSGNRSNATFESTGGTFRLWLSWDPSYTGGPLTASLYRYQNGERALVARSVPYRGDGMANQRLIAATRPGRYVVVVRGMADAAGVEFAIESPTHAFSPSTASGSISPPASDPGVIAVGAIDPRDGQVERFSGRGPTADGRLGVDVVAPNRRSFPGREGFVGTSGSAAYTAGVVALLLDADPSLTPREVEAVLERTAEPVGPPGPDPTTGYGRLAPIEAVNETRSPTVKRRLNRRTGLWSLPASPP